MSNTINPNQIRPYSADGELVGTQNGATVPIKIVGGLGISVTMAAGQIIIATSSTPALTISSFSGGSTVELGQSVPNPTFVASYVGTPISANVSNTDGTDSPHNLSAPYTSVTISGTFMKNTTSTTTFTLHASDGTNNPTSTQVIAWNPAIFAGVGALGATSSVTASGTTALLSTGDALARTQLGAEAVGLEFGPFNPSGQAIYLLLTGGSHTFIDANTGFPFPFNSPTLVSFVNVYGVPVTMYLYQSTNTLSGNFAPKVAS